MKVELAAARQFLRTDARIVERRSAEFFLDHQASAAPAVIHALEAYRNADGGFGHGLESDALAPDSQPLAVDTAFDLLADIAESSSDPTIVSAASDAVRATMGYLDLVAGAEGGLPIVLPSAAPYPRAEHWGDCVFPPALNPTARIVGNARAVGVDHPWLERAADFCRTAIAVPGAVADAHTALCVLRFLETEPDQETAQIAIERLCSRLPEVRLFQSEPVEGYGLTPLDFAPDPNSPRRA
jgi:hypothetical protein